MHKHHWTFKDLMKIWKVLVINIDIFSYDPSEFISHYRFINMKCIHYFIHNVSINSPNKDKVGALRVFPWLIVTTGHFQKPYLFMLREISMTLLLNMPSGHNHRNTWRAATLSSIVLYRWRLLLKFWLKYAPYQLTGLF